MAYSYTEKKRIRKDFGKLPHVMDVPYLLAIQLDSYRKFTQADQSPSKREDIGLHAAFRSVFPIVSYSGNAALEYVSYRLGDPVFDVKECQLRGLTYARDGKISVLVGSRAKLGTGVNIQRRVIAIFQMDPTWKLTPITQSLGRGQRQRRRQPWRLDAIKIEQPRHAMLGRTLQNEVVRRRTMRREHGPDPRVARR